MILTGDQIRDLEDVRDVFHYDKFRFEIIEGRLFVYCYSDHVDITREWNKDSNTWVTKCWATK